MEDQCGMTVDQAHVYALQRQEQRDTWLAMMDRKDAEIARLTAENRLLVEFVEAEWAVGAGIVGYDLHNAAVERFRAANEAVKPILARYRDGANE